MGKKKQGEGVLFPPDRWDFQSERPLWVLHFLDHPRCRLTLEFPRKQSRRKIHLWCLNIIPGQQNRRERNSVSGKEISRKCLIKLLTGYQSITSTWIHRGVLWFPHLIIGQRLGEEVYEFNFSVLLVSFQSLTKFTSSCITFLLYWVMSFWIDSGGN